MVDKIRKIRGWIVERGLDIDIEVDGGVIHVMQAQTARRQRVRRHKN